MSSLLASALGARERLQEADASTREVPPGVPSQSVCQSRPGSTHAGILEVFEAGGGVRANPDGGDTVKQLLQHLAQREWDRVLTVRKISRLGYDSPTLLNDHFQRYGAVEGVYVPVRPRVRRQGQPASSSRPANLAFVVMKSASAAAAVLADRRGCDIGGATISVAPFEAPQESAFGL